jgi:hypothetical protein
MKQQWLALISLALGLSACQGITKAPWPTFGSIQKTLQGTWRLSAYDRVGIKPDAADTEDAELLRAAANQLVVKTGCVLNFFPDSTYTKISGDGNYEQGQWQYMQQDGVLLLTHNGQTDTIQTTLTQDRKSKTITLYGRTTIETFYKTYEPLEQFRKDPYHPNNNSWRIKPRESETSEQLQERLGAYFKHNAYVLDAAIIRKQPSVTFVFSQGPVKIYNGGIGIYPYDQVPQSWKDVHFNEQDAQRAHTMYATYLEQSNNYHGKASGFWYKDDYDILLAIYGDLKAGKFPL